MMSSIDNVSVRDPWTRYENSRILKLAVLILTCACVGWGQNTQGPSQSKDTPGAALVRNWNNEVMRFHGEMQARNSEAARSEGARAIASRAKAFRALIQEDPGRA